ncbi:MAG TPA: DUF4097 family beta strand repeat-containing protein [Thermoanaerobaculia bacterium]|nr:DUF4097 family beta strand repeat-containing protein [Thermoanaerobaculia bacterium]
MAVLAAGGCREHRHRSGSNAVRATITRNWPSSGISLVKVGEVDGDITVEAATGNEISLLATAKGDLEIKKGQENDGLFETKIVGDTLRIGRNESEREGIHFFWDMDDKKIDYVLKVPPTVSLVVMTVNGKIATRGVDGEMKATTVNGPIEIETAGTSELQASTVNGRVRAKFTRGFTGARFKTVNGGVTATLPAGASFAVNLSQVNGDFEASFPLSIHSNPGSRRVSGDVNGGEHELKITTVNGDVELARLGGT